MKSSRRLTLVVAAFLVPLAAYAHPGHDGGHDLEWDTAHLAAHPAATLLCVAVLAAGIWAVWQLVRSRRGREELVSARTKSRR